MNTPSREAALLAVAMGVAGCGTEQVNFKDAACYNKPPVTLEQVRHSSGADSPYTMDLTVADLEQSKCWKPPLDVELKGGCLDEAGAIRNVTYKGVERVYGTETYTVSFTRATATSDELDAKGKPYPCVVPVDVLANVTEIQTGEQTTSNHLNLTGYDPVGEEQ